jgi:hypothetical protein
LSVVHSPSNLLAVVAQAGVLGLVGNQKAKEGIDLD